MFHVKQFIQNIKLSHVFLLLFLVSLPLQTRILYWPDQAYISWYFNYHLAFFIYLSDLFLILCFTSFVLESGNNVSQNVSRTNPKFKWLVLAIFLWSVVTLFHVKHLNLGIYSIFKLIELLGIVYLIPKIVKQAKLFRICLWILLFSGLIQALLAVGQFHVQHQAGLTWLGEYIAPLGTSGLSTLDVEGQKIIRAYGTTPHPNVLAGFLLLPLIAGLYLVSRETNTKKWLILAIFILFITWGLFLTFSRTAWIAALIIFVAYLIYMFHPPSLELRRTGVNKKAFTTIFLVFIVSCGTLGLAYKPYLVSRATDIVGSRSTVDRNKFNQFGLELIKDSPILGTGVGNYIPVLLTKHKLEAWQYQPAHNIYIFLGAELGLIGLGLFILLFYFIIRSSWQSRGRLETFSFLLLIFVYLLMGMFDHYFLTIQQGRLAFFTVLGFLLAARNINEQN